MRIEKNDLAAAERKLAPFLAKGNAFHDLALFHKAEIDTALRNEAAASRDRMTLIFEYPNALHRDEAIDDETEFLAHSSAKALIAFSARLYPTASPERRRDLDAHIVEALIRGGDANGALARALQVLRGGTTDDPADRTSLAIDRPALITKLNAQQLATLGEAMHNHRHFDRAVALLSRALGRLAEETRRPARPDPTSQGDGRGDFS